MRRNIGMLLILLLLLCLGWYNNHQIEQQRLEIIQLRYQLFNLQMEQQELVEKLSEFLGKWNVAVMEVTSYSPYDNRSGICNDGNPNTTATGTRPGPGTIAVNPEVISYGSRVYVQGYGPGIAADTGGAIRAREDLIDVFHWTYDEAMAWGRRKAVVIWEL